MATIHTPLFQPFPLGTMIAESLACQVVGQVHEWIPELLTKPFLNISIGNTGLEQLRLAKNLQS